MDDQGNGIPNASNPVGDTSNVSVSTANLTGVSVTLGDPATVMLTQRPLSRASPESTTEPSLSTLRSPIAAAWRWRLTTPSSGASRRRSHHRRQQEVSRERHPHQSLVPEPAHEWQCVLLPHLRNLTGTNVGPYSQVIGPVTIASPTVGNIVTGSVSFAAADLGPLYVGFYNQGTGAFYGSTSPRP